MDMIDKKNHHIKNDKTKIEGKSEERVGARQKIKKNYVIKKHETLYEKRNRVLERKFFFFGQMIQN